MASATVTSKGQITIPKEVRDRLRLRTGDRLEFVLRPDGEIVMRPAKGSLRDLDRILQRKGQRALSVEQMDAGIARLLGRRR